MTEKEVKLYQENNLPEGIQYKPINQSDYGHMDLQWFAEDPPAETPPAETPPAETPPAETKPPETPPAESKLPGWVSGLTAEQQEKYGEELKDVAKVSDFFNSHIELKGRMENAIIKPGEGATEQELAAYRKALGVPETKEGYYLEKPKLPEGLGDAVSEDWFREMAHKRNLPKQVAADIFQDYYSALGEAYSKQLTARKEVRDSSEKALREKHGSLYDSKLATGKLAAQNIFGAEYMNYLDKSGDGNNISVITGFIRLGELISEDSFVKGKVTTPLPQTGGEWSFPNTPGME